MVSAGVALRGRLAALRRRADAPALAPWALAAGAGIVVYALATTAFAHHTTNHDEAVYLQQAAMLLEGRLVLRPPSVEAFRPWFFVVDGGALYPKYAPVPAATFAVGKLLGGYRVALALVAAGIVGLTHATVAEAFDRRTGLLAAGLLAASPLFLVQASVFLPYAPTTLFNLAFAAAYLRADRTGRLRHAAAAGVAVGVAFFARPYTAVLFAVPFVAHALWTLPGDGLLGRVDVGALRRQSIVAAGGLAGVAAALGYNAVVTGDPLLFPYEAFAPEDGLGFGHREILGYERDYTPALALRANAEVLWLFVTRWAVAAPFGVLVAAAGLAVAVRRGLSARQATLAGLFVSVPAGNVYFWGNLNVLGALEIAGDGLVATLGPYYHHDLLVPVAAFAAVALLAAADALWPRIRPVVVERPAPGNGSGAGRGPDGERARRLALAGLVLAGAVGGAGVTVAAAADPLAENAAITDRLDRAYEPFDERDLDEGLVFLPTPYGDWLNHPFQELRNDPGYDDGTVYALREDQFAVVDAFPEREYYRYGYRGTWGPADGEAVTPRLERIRLREGPAVRQRTTVGVPEYGQFVALTLSSDAETATTSTAVVDASIATTLVVDDGTATLSGPGFEPIAVPVEGRDAVSVRAFVDSGTGSGVTYRTELPVQRREGRVRALSPLEEVCRAPQRCGGEAAHVPGSYRNDAVRLETTLTAGDASGSDANENETAAESGAGAPTTAVTEGAT